MMSRALRRALSTFHGASSMASSSSSSVRRHTLAATDSIEDALASAAALGEPLILHLGEAGHSLLPNWTPRYLAEAVPVLTRVYVSESSHVFGPYHDAGRPMANVHNLTATHGYHEAADMRTADFFDDNKAGTYRYYSGEVDRDLPEALLSDLRPLEHVLVARGPQRASVNMWLGRAPVSAPCHFDGYENTVAQLHGTKRFLLAPPAAYKALRPFPFLHPSHAQCQQTIASLSPDEANAIGVLDASLSRGDLLFLPPMWFHETIVPSGDAIGVNGWVDGDEGAAAAEMFSIARPPLSQAKKNAAAAPPAHHGERNNKASGAAALILLLSRSAFAGDAVGDGGSSSSTLLARRVWQERYAELDLPEASPPPFATDGSCAEWQPGLRAWRDDEAARRWAQSVARHAAAHLPDSTKGSWLGNLAEYIAAERVGVGHVAAFFQALNMCLEEYAPLF